MMKQKPEKPNNDELKEIKPERNEEQAPQAEPVSEEEISPETVETIDWETVANEKEKQAAELLERLQRTMAEFDNFRKRTIKEKASIFDDGVKDTIEQLLPVMDNFERALSSVEDKENNIFKGIEMIYRQFSEILKRIGVEPVPGVGEQFNHNIHEAVAHTEDETFGENIITEVLLKGYKYKDKIIRPSMVKVVN